MTKKIRLLVTAGPTREKLDPVRFLSNVSTGKMGYETARVARKFGLAVTLISGPTQLKPPRGIKWIPVVTAREMKWAVLKEFRHSDALIMTAAVCDYTPVRYSPRKIKRVKQKMIRFKRTDDILAAVGKIKKGKVVMGFALETENVEQNAASKMKEKNLDYIVANWYGPRNNPFGNRQTSMILIARNRRKRFLKRVTKSRAARELVCEILNCIKQKQALSGPKKS